ncbi:MAG: hypothetical protein KGR26_11475, partial [Cyanobacteria bacterium REEB65]|nr:hypothetical protein [Cyanobacteria bacterium REEB65]
MTRSEMATILAAALVLTASPAGAQAPDPGPGWGWIGQQDQRYFLPASAVSESTSSVLLDSTLTGSAVVRLDDKTAAVREFGKVYDTQSETTRTVDLGMSRVRNGGRIEHYHDWKTEQVRLTTPMTPYVDENVETWKERTDQTFRNAYAERETFTWQDPVTAQVATASSDHPLGAVSETVLGTTLVPGRLVMVLDKGVQAGNPVPEVLSSVLHHDFQYATAIAVQTTTLGDTRHSDVFAGDASHGSARPGGPSARDANQLTGFGKEKSTGGRQGA